MGLVKGQPKLRLEHKKPGLKWIKWTLETKTQGVKKKEHFYLNTLYLERGENSNIGFFIISVL